MTRTLRLLIGLAASVATIPSAHAVTSKPGEVPFGYFGRPALSRCHTVLKPGPNGYVKKLECLATPSIFDKKSG